MKIAVLVPCYNEEAAIAKVVHDFRAALPGAGIYVYDNNSRDNTMARAAEAGATVRMERRQGKGNVVRRMFADIEADIYVLVDGDDTYDAGAAGQMVAQLITQGADILTARRVHTAASAYRPGHVFGNKMLTGLTATLFNVELSDMLSGYRVFSRRFVKSFPFTAEGFAIETELTIHAVRLMMPMTEMDTMYKERPIGSVSKLNTWRDGFRILGTIFYLMREERPLLFFAAIATVLARRVAVPGRAGDRRIRPDRSGAAPAHRRAGHQPDDHRLPVADLRADPGHGDPRPLGGQAHGLSRHSRRPGHV